MDAKMGNFKKGMIILWSGSLPSIPNGWTVCNGSYGTPDLSDRFVIGSSLSYPVDDTGGAENHVHPGSPASHGHYIDVGGDIAAGGDYGAATGDPMSTGNTGSGGGLPPYYALAYIMKL